MQTQKIKVVDYKDRKAFEKDANRLANDGWRVVSVEEKSQRSGLTRMLLLNFFALVWKPKAHLLVTYQRD